jgi:hypothetical protein
MLTDDQAHVLAPVFDKLESDAKGGNAGLLLAQVMPSRMILFRLDHERGKEFQRVIGVEESKIGKAGGG